MIRFVINIDDFGQTLEKNQAVVDCHRFGLVKSTTLLVGQPRTREAVAIAHQNPDLGVGVHLNISEGAPLLNVEGYRRAPVDENGQFFGGARVRRRASVGAVDVSWVRDEFEAQIEKARSLGIEPTHIDSHQHTHTMPAIARAAVHAARRQGVRFIRLSPNFFRGVNSTWGARIGRTTYRRVAKVFVNGYFRKHLRCADWFWPIQIAQLVQQPALLDALPDGTFELNSHPKPGSAAYVALTDRRLVTELRDRGIEMVSYKDLS